MKKNKKIHIISKQRKWLLIIAGSFFVALGIIGILIPLLPTTPFLLLASACYIRSSERLYNWLINNRLLGIYLRNYIENKAIPLKIKLITISILWLTIGYSIIFVIHVFLVKFILILIAIGVSIHIVCMRTYKK